MDPKLDRHQSTSNHNQSLNILQEYMERVNLVDTWRALHQHERRYTWHKCMHGRVMSSHLDMFVVSQFWMDHVHRCEIEPRLLSDHLIVQLEVCLDHYLQGPGVWGFNNRLLLDTVLTNKVNECVKYVDSITPLLNPCDRWEYLKMEVCTVIQDYSVKKPKKNRDDMQQLMLLKQKLETDLQENPDNVNLKTSLEDLNHDLDQYAISKASESIFCSKCQYAREGEECSVYFMSLEKHRYMETNMKCVILPNGTPSCCQRTILEEEI